MQRFVLFASSTIFLTWALLAGLVSPASAMDGLLWPPGASTPPVSTTTTTVTPVFVFPEEGTYAPPVSGPVVDGFRLPERPWLPGNRGLEYATISGEEVHAAADGEVIFAGQVGGSLHVTVLHPDGLRTSYSFLASLRVTEGQAVRTGTTLGQAAERLHFGVRDTQGRYLDPSLVVGRQPALRAQLTPHVDSSVDAAAREARRRTERSFFGRVADAAGSAAGWVGDQAGGTVEAVVSTAAMTASLGEWMIKQPVSTAIAWANFGADLFVAVKGPADCTPADVQVGVPSGERVAIVVPGLNQTSFGGPPSLLNTEALGLASSDIVRFSYAGGRAPAAELDGAVTWDDPLLVTTHDNSAPNQAVQRSGEMLAGLIFNVSLLRPDATIEIYGHSLGGLVAIAALNRLQEQGSLPNVRLVTLATPHRGSTLAQIGDAFSLLPETDVVGEVLGLPALGEPVLWGLARGNSQKIPSEVPALSVAATTDLMVPPAQSVLEGGRSAIILVDSLRPHEAITEAPAATREMSLFLAGQPAACKVAARRVFETVLPFVFDRVHNVITGGGILEAAQ